MRYELECALAVLVSTIFIALALFLGMFVNKLFGLFLVGAPIPFIVYGIKCGN